MKFKNLQKAKRFALERRHRRIRSHVRGTALRPRLVVYRSVKHTSAQVIDDVGGVTVAAADDQKLTTKGKTAKALEVGKLVAERARAKGVTAVVFDRGGRAYHGRVKAVAEGARAGGLIF